MGTCLSHDKPVIPPSSCWRFPASSCSVCTNMSETKKKNDAHYHPTCPYHAEWEIEEEPKPKPSLRSVHLPDAFSWTARYFGGEAILLDKESDPVQALVRWHKGKEQIGPVWNIFMEESLSVFATHSACMLSQAMAEGVHHKLAASLVVARVFAQQTYRQSLCDQNLQHRPNGADDEYHRHNSKLSAVIQDAFLIYSTEPAFERHQNMCRGR